MVTIPSTRKPIWERTKRSRDGLIVLLALTSFAAAVTSAHSAGPIPQAQSEAKNHVAGQVKMADGATANASTVVWLEAPGLHGAPLKNAVLDQRDKTFIPHILVVTPGTRILFPNNDTVFHNVFAEFEAKKFDLGVYPRGAKRVQTFEKPGVVSVLCNIHPRMSAFILIVDTPYFGKANKKGEFDLSGIPAGNYTLHVWHETGETATQKCVVAENSVAPMTIQMNVR